MDFIIFLIGMLIGYSVANAIQRECFLLMVGKYASKSGNMLLAHNNDLSGSEASMSVKIPKSKEMIYLSDSANIYGKPASMLVVQIYKGFSEGDAAAINDYGVAIAGGLSLKLDRNTFVKSIDPLKENGLGGGIRYFALQHAKTARQCVKVIGECYDKYGIAYPSGVGIADSNEIWYMEAGGGRSWAAIRIPNDCYFVAANSYRIRKVDFSDTLNFLYSTNLQKLYKKYVLSRDTAAQFDFAGFFGGGVREKDGNNFYNSRRIWRTIDWLNPQLNLPAGTENFPMFIRPENKITLKKCFSILRDYYKDTPYDIFEKQNRKKPERAIATFKGVHTEVIEIAPSKPVEFGSILWAGVASPFTAVYIPFYFGIDSIPPAYGRFAVKSDTNSAFWIFKTLGDLGKDNYKNKMKTWRQLRRQLESDIIKKQSIIIQNAEKMIISGSTGLSKYLEENNYYFSRQATNLAKEMLNNLMSKQR